MRVTFLGTGSAVNKGRLLNSILVDGELLLEPSPTSVWAMQRLGLPFRRLQAIVVTHVHADHTFGLPQILLELKRARRPVPLIGPPGFRSWVRTLLRLAYPDSTFAYSVIELRAGTLKRLGPWQIRAVAMRHTVRAHGYLLSKGASTLGYSGDTALGPGLQQLVASSDAAILEMTTSTTHLEGHLTARDIAAVAGSIPLVVTHLSEQRPRVPRGVRIARDLQTLRLP
jgi:ribonuclease Z